MRIQKKTVSDLCRITIDPVSHGRLIVKPDIDSTTVYPRGTVFSLSGEAEEGYQLDSLYFSVPGPWGPMYHESTVNPMRLSLNQDVNLGASFLPTGDLEGFRVIHDVVYAVPASKPLKYDVFTPHNAESLPLVVIIHGGGWSFNDHKVMRGMAREIVKTGKYVVASIDYRWIGIRDGDATPNRMNQLIEDVFGALAHIQEHAEEYGADPGRIAVTGDSAGGHLSASAATMIERIGPKGFRRDCCEFTPSYIPAGMSAGELAVSFQSAVKVAAPSYGVFSSDELFEYQPRENDQALSAVSPLNNIPDITSRSIPHYLIRGTEDPLISYEMLGEYARALEAAGQTVVHREIEGAGHAFFDWKPDAQTREQFKRFGIPCITDMLEFIDRYL